ncbi:hypothetical protein BDU57DRAFT_541805 [Ampelomyces quisqualis]|uniref:SUR7/PalI family-domain-containing protein n=1 Tax=Ampelomyces quisqualis TaxID=50730 RepID=A0A6A5QEA6_AMPQU|nr:hypothetical protein BDU57DRAFT_541805 [Ampelomyces quisqualis]
MSSPTPPRTKPSSFKSIITNLFTTLLSAHSSSLPGPTSNAILSLFLAIAFSITCLATTLAAGVQIIQRGDKVACRALGSGIVRWVDADEGITFYGYGMDDGAGAYGLGTVQRIGSVDGGWGGKVFTIFASIIIPPIGTALFVGLLSVHFLPFGVPNRLGFLAGLVLLAYTGLSAVFVAGMSIDTHPDKVDRANICALSAPSATTFQAQKSVRTNLATASYIFAALQIVCIMAYLVLTLYAALLNRENALNADVRLRQLRAAEAPSPSTYSLPTRLGGREAALMDTAHSVPRRAASEADVDVDVEIGTWGAAARERWTAGGHVGVGEVGVRAVDGVETTARKELVAR